MSTAGRLISGSVASWAQIGVTMAAQIILVPVYLSHWDVKTYGIWLAIQGIMSALSMLDLGYQTYMGFEFLRLGQKNIPDLCKSLWSAIVFGVMIALAQILLVCVFTFTDILPFLLGENRTDDFELLRGAGIVLILQGITWLFLMTIPGLMVRVLSVFGYYPRMAWWAFLYAIMTALAPLVAVIMGADLLGAGIALAASAFGYGVLFYIDLVSILKKQRIKLIKPSLKLGYSNFRLSLPLLGKSLFENVRQQGVRLVLAPLAGPIGLAAFSTMRTGANVALQGLNTIINPLLPDLMRFLHDRDQPRSEAAFSTIWIVIVAFLAPGVVMLQMFIEPFYVYWTQGKIEFDPLLFALLSLGVLVYAVVQPAMAVVIGNNLTKVQFMIAAIAGVILFAVLSALVPIIGIIGAAIALLLAEIVAAVFYKVHAQRWLRDNQLMWPKKAFGVSIVSVAIAAVSLAFIIFMPQIKWLIFAISMILFAWNFWRSWQGLPTVAIDSAKNFMIRVPGLRRLVVLFDQ
jgi:O-antigen/teichoic acid export membrane protein